MKESLRNWRAFAQLRQTFFIAHEMQFSVSTLLCAYIVTVAIAEELSIASFVNARWQALALRVYSA